MGNHYQRVFNQSLSDSARTLTLALPFESSPLFSHTENGATTFTTKPIWLNVPFHFAVDVLTGR